MSASDQVRDHFDALGHGEWERLERAPRDRVSLELHRRFLARHLLGGPRVLEIGAGPGRFTGQLADLGARVVVTDVSPVQLGLNAARLSGSPAVERHELLDIADTSRFADAEFAAVLAYGGALSYVFEAARMPYAVCSGSCAPAGR